MRYLDQAVTEAGGIALRYGGFYGASNDELVPVSPGWALNGSAQPLIKPVRKGLFPIIGDGGGVSSWVHLDDAAAATVLALEHDGAGIYTSSTTSPPQCTSGCRCWRTRSAPSRLATFPAGSHGQSGEET